MKVMKAWEKTRGVLNSRWMAVMAVAGFVLVARAWLLPVEPDMSANAAPQAEATSEVVGEGVVAQVMEPEDLPPGEREVVEATNLPGWVLRDIKGREAIFAIKVRGRYKELTHIRELTAKGEDPNRRAILLPPGTKFLGITGQWNQEDPSEWKQVVQTTARKSKEKPRRYVVYVQEQ